MTEDLRRTIATSMLESRKSVRDKWAPGSWAAAATYNSLPKPEPRFPVIIGGDSIVQTANDPRGLCQLPSTPPTSQTTKASLIPLRSEKRRDQATQTLEISDVNFDQFLDLQQRTEGHMLCVWFHGDRRYAWLAHSAKAEEQTPQRTTSANAFCRGTE